MKQNTKRGALQLKMLFAAVVLTLSISASTGTVDYSRSCYNPSAYSGTATYTNYGLTMTCDSWYSNNSGSGQVFENVDWSTVTASTFPSNVNASGLLNMLKGSCCSDGKGILWEDYSRSCYNPSAYSGTATYTNDGQTNTCDSWYSSLSGSGQDFENVDWGNVNASTFPSNAVNTLNMLKGSCCSDGKGILWNAPAPSPAPSANITSPALDLNTDDSKRRVSFHFIVSSIMPTIFALMQSIRFV